MYQQFCAPHGEIAITPITQEIRIAAPRETVWDYVQDFDRRGEWDVRILRGTKLTVGDLQVGSRVRYELRSLPGMTLRLAARYSSYSPLERSAIVFEKLPWWQLLESAAGAWRFTSLADGTLFRSTFRYKLKLGRLGQWLDDRFFRQQLEQETLLSLANLKRVIETDVAMANA